MLPSNWEDVEFGEINQFISRFIEPAITPREVFELYSVPSFPSGSPEIQQGSAIGSTKQMVEPGDVLVCKINPRINRVWQVKPRHALRQIASSEWVVMRAPEVEARFLRYFFSSSEFRDLICQDVTGVGGSLTRAQPKRIATFSIPIAPLNEQKRIANKLDAILARVDACRERLDRVPAILKRFRQAVLAAATSGILTEEWRGENTLIDATEEILQVQKNKWNWIEKNPGHNEGGRVKKRLMDFKEDNLKKGNLPDSWRWAAIEDICCLVVDCHNKTAPYQQDGIPLIRTSNIRDGKLLWQEMKFVSEETYAYWSRRCLPEPGDIIFTREAPIGEAAIISPKLRVCLGQRTMLFRPFHNLTSNKYLLYSIMSPTFMARTDDIAVGTGVKHFRIRDVSNLLLPIPSLSEQLEIVRRVETLLTYADRLESRYHTARTHLDNLTPSLLAKAFRGELVPQDPTDEPASVLLDRLRAARAAAPAKAKGRRGKAV